MRRRSRAILACLFVAGAAVALAAGSLAHKAGGTDRDGIEGCGPAGACHPEEGNVRSYIRVRLDGLPVRFTPGQTYPLHLDVGPKERARAAGPGGYAVDVFTEPEGSPPGYFTSGDKDSKLAAGSDTMTHTSEGTERLDWRFNWTAPSGPQTVRFWATGMFSLGSFLGQDSDHWNTESWILRGAPAPSPAPVLGALLGLGVVAALRRRP